jgi:uncharacterized membrane protein
LLVALALPLWFRRIPPNWFYGARFAATLKSRDVWYAINARAGRNLVLIGAGYLLLVCALAIDPRLNSAAALLGVTTAFVATLIVNTIVLRRATERLTRTLAHREDRGAAF